MCDKSRYKLINVHYTVPAIVTVTNNGTWASLLSRKSACSSYIFMWNVFWEIFCDITWILCIM